MGESAEALELGRALNRLQNTNSAVEKKRALISIHEWIESSPDKCLHSAWHGSAKLCSNLTKVLQDPSERCREITAEILLTALEKMPTVSAFGLSSVFPIITHRLAASADGQLREPSEEVRHLLITLVLNLLDKCPQDSPEMVLFNNDLVSILKATVVDPFGDIKRISCMAVVSASKTLKNDFHLNSSSLLVPLTRGCLGHQQNKVRVAAIEAVGAIMVQSRNSDDLKTVISHLAQRLFDPVPAVRLQVSLVAADLLLNWPTAYSNCAYLLPLLLTGLDDDFPDNVSQSRQLWEKVGQAWIFDEAQRDSRMKDRIDFQCEQSQPRHYPADVVRPSVGCREYLTRVVYKLLPALDNDLSDWLVETRVKASSLLFIIMSHMEESSVATQHADKILNLMLSAAKDDEVQVVKNVCKVGNVYGHFVPPKTWVSLVCSKILSIEPRCCTTDLMILALIIEASDPELFHDLAEDLVLALQDDAVCLKIDTAYLEELLSCSNAIMSKVNQKTAVKLQPHLFKIGMTVMGLAQDEDLKQLGRGSLTLLAKACEVSLEALYKRETGVQLSQMKKECDSWSHNSHRLAVFSTLMTEAGPAVGHFTDLVVDIFNIMLSRSHGVNTGPACTESTKDIDYEMQLKLFIILSKQLYSLDKTLNSQEYFSNYSLKVLGELIVPSLKWHAGRKACAVRTAAASCLWSFFENEQSGEVPFLDLDILVNSHTYPSLLTSMNGLVEDESEQTRLFICKTYRRLFNMLGPKIGPQILLKIASVLIKRLDDNSDEVRIACLDAMAESSNCLKGNFCSKDLELELGKIFSLLLVHIDDPHIEVRKKVRGTLQTLGATSPKVLLQMTEDAVEKCKHKDACSELLKHLQDLDVK